jgi:hypothetical protein
MSPKRSLIVAGGLTALVIVAVLLVGARQGAFGLGSQQETVLLPADGAAMAPDALTSAEPVQRTHRDDDDEDDDDDRDEEEDEEDDEQHDDD